MYSLKPSAVGAINTSPDAVPAVADWNQAIELFERTNAGAEVISPVSLLLSFTSYK